MQKLVNHIIYIANKNDLPLKSFHLQKNFVFHNKKFKIIFA